MIDQDSSEVSFTTEFFPIKNEVVLKFEKIPENIYQVSAFPGAITDLFQDTNDTIVQRVRTKALSEYGRIIVNLQNIQSFPIIVQLTTTKGEVMAEQYSENSSKFTFDFLNPGDFLIRVIYDTNSNMKWDTGNYLKKRQPERILYYPDTIDVRSNWDKVETFSLK